MRYHTIDSALFIANRKKVCNQLRPNSLVVLHANDIMPKNTDGTMPFVQNDNLFYCTGIDQENTMLLLYPDAIREEWREVLFIEETNATIAMWEGYKYSKADASALSGIERVEWLSAFKQMFHTLMALAENIYLHMNEHVRATCLVETSAKRFIGWCQDAYPLHRYERLAPIMHQLRGIKEETEIMLMQQACDITAAGFQSILPIVRPGLLEYEIEAQCSYEFLRRGSRGFAYTPIVASGKNSCVLHYIHNNAPLPAGGLVLVDVGAEYANYSADLTRVLPVDGRFTKRQRAIYNAVLRILKAAQEVLCAGLLFDAYQKEVVALVESELVALKLIDRSDIKNQEKEAPAYKKYFMHGISHHVGLSTHDLGDTYGKVLPQMVLTIEPGIYIPEENIGIRLEDNVVIRAEGVQNLMAAVPIEVDEIEEMMHREGGR